jgi:hypothetical protein
MGIRNRANRNIHFPIIGIDLNPWVTLFTLGWLWGFIIWVLVAPESCMTEVWWWVSSSTACVVAMLPLEQASTFRCRVLSNARLFNAPMYMHARMLLHQTDTHTQAIDVCAVFNSCGAGGRGGSSGPLYGCTTSHATCGSSF